MISSLIWGYEFESIIENVTVLNLMRESIVIHCGYTLFKGLIFMNMIPDLKK